MKKCRHANSFKNHKGGKTRAAETRKNLHSTLYHAVARDWNSNICLHKVHVGQNCSHLSN